MTATDAGTMRAAERRDGVVKLAITP